MLLFEIQSKSVKLAKMCTSKAVATQFLTAGVSRPPVHCKPVQLILHLEDANVDALHVGAHDVIPCHTSQQTVVALHGEQGLKCQVGAHTIRPIAQERAELRQGKREKVECEIGLQHLQDLH